MRKVLAVAVFLLPSLILCVPAHTPASCRELSLRAEGHLFPTIASSITHAPACQTGFFAWAVGTQHAACVSVGVYSCRSMFDLCLDMKRYGCSLFWIGCLGHDENFNWSEFTAVQVKPRSLGHCLSVRASAKNVCGFFFDMVLCTINDAQHMEMLNENICMPNFQLLNNQIIRLWSHKNTHRHQVSLLNRSLSSDLR